MKNLTQGLEFIKGIINTTRSSLKEISNLEKKDDIVFPFTVAINNLNYVRAELVKLDAVFNIVKKHGCKEQLDPNEALEEVKKSLNKLVEIIQKYIRKSNLDFSLLILT